MRLLMIGLLMACASPLARAETPDVDIDTESAKRHFAKAVEFYDANDYEHALAEFEAARDARPLPALNYNIARCLDRLERFEEAIKNYRFYLQDEGATADAQDARRRIEVLQDRLARRRARAQAGQGERPATPATSAPAPARPERSPALGAVAPAVSARPAPPPAVESPHLPPAPSPHSPAGAGRPMPASPSPIAAAATPVRDPPPAEPAGRRWLIAPAILGAAGVAVLIAGVGVTAWGYSNYQGFAGTCSPRCNPQDTNPLHGELDAGYALLGVGAAALAVDAAVWALAARGRHGRAAEKVALTPRLLPGGVGLSLGGEL